MSTLTKEQVLKFAAAWQAMILLVTWYLNTFGIDTINRLLFGVALLVVLVILFLKKDNTEKVAVAIGTVDRFLKSQQETQKAKEASEKDVDEDLIAGFFQWLADQAKPKTEEEKVLDEPEVI